MDFNKNATADYLELRRRRVQEILLNREMRGSNDDFTFKNLVIPGIELRSANLYAGNRVGFQGCDLRFADFSFTEANRVYFAGSNVCFANFDDSNLTHATFGETTRIAGASFRRANLDNATMYMNVMLLTADFTDAKNIESMFFYVKKDRSNLRVTGVGVDPETGLLRPETPTAETIKRVGGSYILFSQIYDQMALPAKMLNESIVKKLRDPHEEPRARTELAELPELMKLLEKTLPVAPLQIIPAPKPEAPKPEAPRAAPSWAPSPPPPPRGGGWSSGNGGGFKY